MRGRLERVKLSRGTMVLADLLIQPWFGCLEERLPDLRLFDCHTHLGADDPDGSRLTARELQQALDVVQGRAVVFPLPSPPVTERPTIAC